jgi:AcrR family transcriptional regulator
MAKKKSEEVDLSTAEKIKEAAEKVFMQKGYSATRTRDIAEAADINLALLNYYYRSKEKLFEIIMFEKLNKFFGSISPVLNDTSANLEQKIAAISTNYIDLLSQNPDLPLFILSEIRNSPEQFVHKLPVTKLFESHFIKQLMERRPDLNPAHFFMNLLGMTVFPFIMKPLFQASGVLSEKVFAAKMIERKVLIPKWMNAILKTK